MRTRMIKPGERDRMMVRTNSSAALCTLVAAAKAEGYQEVGLVKFLWHIVFPSKTNDQNT